MSGLPSWDDLRLLDAVAVARSLPAAAARLGIDHSTVFRRLRQIEAALGTKVFERSAGLYVPTASGAEIVALAARMADDLDAVLRRVAGQSPNPAGEVRIATSDALLTRLLLPLLADFRRACPALRLDLVTGNTALNLSRRDADIAIRATAAPQETLIGRKVARIAWAPYATGAMAEAPDLLAAGPWVGFGDALSGLDMAAHERAKLAPDRIVARFDTVGGMLAGLEAGLGGGWLPCFAGDDSPALVRLAPPLPPSDAALWLLTHPDLRHAPRIRILLDFLAQRLGAMRPMIEGADPA